MKKKAVIVGVSYVDNPTYRLHGCDNDARLCLEVLLSYFRFSLEEIHILMDTPLDPANPSVMTDPPTKDNIKRELQWLMSDAGDGDMRVFHFSGHGTQQEDTSGTELDGLNEALCPCDLNWTGERWENIILDDELFDLFHNTPAGCNLTVILDCCHSGHALDLEAMNDPIVKESIRKHIRETVHVPALAVHKGKDADATVKETTVMFPIQQGRAIPLPSKSQKAKTAATRNRQLLRSVSGRGSSGSVIRTHKVSEVKTTDRGLEIVSSEGAIVLDEDRTEYAILCAACKESETASGSLIAGINHGVFSFFFYNAIKQCDGMLTYRQLMEEATSALRTFGFTQTPQLNCTLEREGFRVLVPYSEGKKALTSSVVGTIRWDHVQDIVEVDQSLHYPSDMNLIVSNNTPMRPFLEELFRGQSGASDVWVVYMIKELMDIFEDECITHTGDLRVMTPKDWQHLEVEEPIKARIQQVLDKAKQASASTPGTPNTPAAAAAVKG
eukprot:CAMPEP_0177648344 /NCGR_PEP_ID=MMETSP0447-20121125/10778_1 /TAXON_ID=0 /ORGANISM="Stygamoeba regulata, Strain BSH-02190019" /LENGTH=497 /DNA_ID=CAMNT_0019150979 /DNA_START=247 /DNA_END=1740 /DNA_ORIENTATION=+